MRRFALALVSTVAALVALLSFKTHSGGLAQPAAAVSTADPTGAATPAPEAGAPAATTPSSTAASSSSSASSATSTGTRTVTGASADTRWGPVQVKITVTDGKVTAAEAVVYPSENGRDQEINAYAIPTLNQEATSAGNANIDSVSGATYTSDGYKTSLQSALDQAGL